MHMNVYICICACICICVCIECGSVHVICTHGNVYGWVSVQEYVQKHTHAYMRA